MPKMSQLCELIPKQEDASQAHLSILNVSIMAQSIKSTSHRFSSWPQWLAASEIFLMALMTGLSLGWASPNLAKMLKPDSTFQISKSEASWIASLSNIARPIGAILGALTVYKIGSKPASLLTGIPFALSWACFLIIESVPLMYLSRFLCGIGIGTFLCVFPLYIGEISDPKIRGTLVSFIMQGFMVGNLAGNIMGTYLDTWIFASISLIPNMIFLGAFFVLPHTPHYLVKCNKMKEAASSILWYNRNANVEIELEVLQKFIQAKQSSTLWDTLKDLTTPINRKTLLMVNIIYGLLQFNGLYTVLSYLEIMLTKARVTIIAPSTVVINASILGIVSSAVAIYTSDKFGRTIMLTISILGVASSMFFWGLNYQLLDMGYDNPNLQWFSLISVIIFKISFSVGTSTVPSILKSEMFAPNIKSLACSITNIISGFLAFAASKSYQPMVNIMTEKYVFWTYALIMVIAAIYTAVYIPETKGKSLPEIQQILTSPRKLEKSYKDKITIKDRCHNRNETKFMLESMWK